MQVDTETRLRHVGYKKELIKLKQRTKLLNTKAVRQSTTIVIIRNPETNENLFLKLINKTQKYKKHKTLGQLTHYYDIYSLKSDSK